MLEQKYIDNLIQLRDWLVANRELVQSHLDFKVYVNTPSAQSGLRNIKDSFIDSITEDCGTVCCAIGWAGISNLFPRVDKFWDQFIARYFGVDIYDSCTGEYLFGVDNLPDFDLMIERFDYVIANGIAPEGNYDDD